MDVYKKNFYCNFNVLSLHNILPYVTYSYKYKENNQLLLLLFPPILLTKKKLLIIHSKKLIDIIMIRTSYCQVVNTD